MTELKLCLCGAEPHIEKEKDPLVFMSVMQFYAINVADVLKLFIFCHRQL